MKICSKCGESKPLSCFRKGKRYKNGLRSQCRDCENLRKRELWVSRGLTKTQLCAKRLEEQDLTNKKTCCSCGESLDFDEFYKDKNRPDGLTYRCRYCHADSYYRKHFGISGLEAKILLKSNDYCQICGKVFTNSKEKHIDHCHNSGQIRGVLCSNCNTALGLIKEDLQTLKSMENYIKKHETS